jgi:putative transposase
VTAATYHKTPLFQGEERLSMLEELLLEQLESFGWQVQAWAVFPNHYHFVGLSPESGSNLKRLTQRVHGISATQLNRLDGSSGRQVWYRYWDTRITFERSYLARLAYVHNNAVRHGVVQRPEEWKWCSAEWFRLRAHRSFFETVQSFRTDTVNVIDDF